MNPLTDSSARLVIAHRGNAQHAPENTLESFAQAVALGADALELDVRVTSDNVPVVIHDPTLARTTDRNDIVADVSFARLRRADAGAAFTRDDGATFPYRGGGLTIPTLAEVLTAFPAMPLIIEVKVLPAAAPVAGLLVEAGAIERVLLASMSDAAISLRGSGFATGASGAEVARIIPAALLGRRSGDLPYEAFCIPPWYYGLPIPVRAIARAAREAGVVTHVWTIDSPEAAKSFWCSGIQGIITNDPERMLRARADFGTRS